MFYILLALCAQGGHTVGSDESALVVYAQQVPVDAIADQSFVLPEHWYALQVPNGISKQVFAWILWASPGIEQVVDGATGEFATRSISNDPYVDDQWHLSNLNAPTFDINIEDAWNLGYYGAGQIIGIADNGVDQSHDDLSANYNASLSTPSISSAHGTSVAGIVVAESENGIGVAGVACRAQWSEQKFGSALLNADTFSWANQDHTVKNNSWGPTDDGELHTITNLELDALKEAVEDGRNSKGIIFTWAAGNGGSDDRVE